MGWGGVGWRVVTWGCGVVMRRPSGVGEVTVATVGGGRHGITWYGMLCTADELVVARREASSGDACGGWLKPAYLCRQ